MWRTSVERINLIVEDVKGRVGTQIGSCVRGARLVHPNLSSLKRSVGSMKFVLNLLPGQRLLSTQQGRS